MTDTAFLRLVISFYSLGDILDQVERFVKARHPYVLGE